MISKNTDDLCLVVTERCNLNCTYCQSNKLFKGTMTWECAKKNIDIYLSKTEVKYPSITFMGGEPFLAFTLIKQVVDYITTEYSKHKIRYTIVTNGTLVHNEIQKWIKDHEDIVQVVLSLDGLGETHDINRNNSLKMIDIEFFQSLKTPIVNSVFTPETISKLAATTIELHLNGFYVKGFIADGELWNTIHVDIMAEQLMVLIDFYIKHPKILPFSLLSQPLYYLTSSESVRRCGTELFSEVSVSANGTIWACHRCSPFENHGTWQIPKKYIDLVNARFLLSQCETCFLEKICNACPASNASVKDRLDLAQVICSIRKLLFKANAFFALSMFTEDNDFVAIQNMTLEKKKHFVQSAKIILDKLS